MLGLETMGDAKRRAIRVDHGDAAASPRRKLDFHWINRILGCQCDQEPSTKQDQWDLEEGMRERSISPVFLGRVDFTLSLTPGPQFTFLHSTTDFERGRRRHELTAPLWFIGSDRQRRIHGLERHQFQRIFQKDLTKSERERHDQNMAFRRRSWLGIDRMLSSCVVCFYLHAVFAGRRSRSSEVKCFVVDAFFTPSEQQ